MYINITDSESGNNKGSCGQLVSYLEKENHIAAMDNRPPELWFNGTRTNIIPQEVRVNIDNNIAKLGQNDAKFFLINISPSQKEITYLKERFGEQAAEQQLKAFTARVMDAYAANFKRSGVKTNHDLVWYAKLEHFRYYEHTDTAVKNRQRKQGEHKEGDQLHVQVIVSRKDITNKIKLSPMNNSRGKNQEHSAKLGQFDRKAFKQSGELLFDQMFGFDRALKDSFNYALTMKDGSSEQKRTLLALERIENRLTEDNKAVYRELTKTIFQQDNQGLEQLLEAGGSLMSGLLDTLLSPEPVNDHENIIPDPKKKKKKKGRLPGQSGG